VRPGLTRESHQDPLSFVARIVPSPEAVTGELAAGEAGRDEAPMPARVPQFEAATTSSQIKFPPAPKADFGEGGPGGGSETPMVAVAAGRPETTGQEPEDRRGGDDRPQPHLRGPEPPAASRSVFVHAINASDMPMGEAVIPASDTAELPPALSPGEMDPPPERLSAPPRQLNLTIPSRREGETVSVQVRDQNGAIEIAVRTPDARLSTSLQDSLPDLVTRLEAHGGSASATAAGSGDPPADGGSRDGQGPPPDRESGSGGETHQRQDPRGESQQHRRRRQAEWEASFATSLR
jgi:hypothetical protein